MACFACLLMACLVRVGPNLPVSMPPFGVLVCLRGLGRFPDADNFGPVGSFILVSGSCVWVFFARQRTVGNNGRHLAGPNTIVMCQPMADLTGNNTVIANVYMCECNLMRMTYE